MSENGVKVKKRERERKNEGGKKKQRNKIERDNEEGKENGLREGEWMVDSGRKKAKIEWLLIKKSLYFLHLRRD